MPRLSSLRPLRSRVPGLVLSACLLGAGVVSFAQSSSDYPSTTPPGYPSSTPPGYGPGANGQDANALQNVPSGIKRSDVSSVVPLQALLYSDVDAVFRFNLAKIDYVGLNDFFGEIVDKGVGSIQSSDSYRVKLRDYQKSELKASFRALLTSLQDYATKNFFANKIDEVYVVEYNIDAADYTRVVAISTDGLSEADQKLALEQLESLLKPISLFNRYGFIVAVLDHQNAVKPDLQAIQAQFLAQAQAQLVQNGASSAASYAGSSSSGSQTIAGVPNALNLPESLYRDYAAAVEEAQTNAKTESRKKVLPYVRRRFEKPADAGSPFFDALKQTDGAALAISFNADGLKTLTKTDAETKNTPDAATLLSGSFAGSKADADEEKAFDFEKFASSPAFDNFKTATVAASLVGSPKLALVVAFDASETAKQSADAATAALTLSKPLVAQQVLAATKGNADADLSPIVDAVFEGLKPQTAGSKVAFVLDLDVLKQNAVALLPLFGGVETKSAQEMESDGIDWDLDGTDEEAPAEETNDATNEEAPAEEDDPFADEADDATDEEAPADEDDPFADEEEDPFA